MPDLLTFNYSTLMQVGPFKLFSITKVFGNHHKKTKDVSNVLYLLTCLIVAMVLFKSQEMFMPQSHTQNESITVCQKSLFIQSASCVHICDCFQPMHPWVVKLHFAPLVANNFSEKSIIIMLILCFSLIKMPFCFQNLQTNGPQSDVHMKFWSLLLIFKG